MCHGVAQMPESEQKRLGFGMKSTPAQLSRVEGVGFVTRSVLV